MKICTFSHIYLSLIYMHELCAPSLIMCISELCPSVDWHKPEQDRVEIKPRFAWYLLWKKSGCKAHHAVSRHELNLRAAAEGLLQP